MSTAKALENKNNNKGNIPIAAIELTVLIAIDKVKEPLTQKVVTFDSDPPGQDPIIKVDNLGYSGILTAIDKRKAKQGMITNWQRIPIINPIGLLKASCKRSKSVPQPKVKATKAMVTAKM